MGNEKIIKKIEEIAIETYESGNKIRRADLAALLMHKTKTIKEDSFAINDLVEQTYRQTDPSTQKAIINTFVSNDLAQSLIRPGRVRSLEIDFSKGYESDIASFEQEQIKNLLKKGLEIVTEYEEEILIITNRIKNYVKKSGGLGGVFKSITGTAKIEKVQNEGQYVYEQYIKLIDFYEEAKKILINYIEDYETIRGNLNAVYVSHVNALKDFFGNQIVAIDPDMFDYDTITWLDSNSMINEIKTAYDDLSERCGTLIGSINSKLMEEGLDTLSTSVESIINIDFSDKKKAKKQAAIAGGMAVANMGIALFEAHMEAAEKAAELGEELEEMKNLFNVDAANIKKEGFRFNKILKTVKHLYLPVTEMVYINLPEVITPDLNDFLHNAYSVEGVKELKDERDQTLYEHRKTVTEILDIKRSLNAYTKKVEQDHSSINGINAIEKFIKKKKLKKWGLLLIIALIIGGVMISSAGGESGIIFGIPFFIGSIVLIILRKKKKNRWITYYTETENDLARIHSYEKQLDAAQTKESDLKIKVQQLSDELQKKLINNSEVRDKLKENLLNIFKVLKSVKRVLSAGLNADDIDPDKIKKKELGEVKALTLEMEQKLLIICGEKAGKIHNKYIGAANTDKVSSTIESTNNGSEKEKQDFADSDFKNSVNNQLKKKLTEDKLKEIAERGANIAIARVNLKAKKEKNLQIKEEYESQLAEKEKAFSRQLLKIENSIEVVSVIRKNLESNPIVDKKDALMALSELIPTDDPDLVIAQQEINNFLSGRDNTITL